MWLLVVAMLLLAVSLVSFYLHWRLHRRRTLSLPRGGAVNASSGWASSPDNARAVLSGGKGE